MKYEITIIENGKETENFIAEEYKAIIARGRLGHTINNEERRVTDIKVRPEGKKRNKCYDCFHHTVIIREVETGRRILTMEKKQY